jgi:hypothetical protein
MLGLSILLRIDSVPCRYFAQVGARALRMKADVLNEEILRSDRLRMLLLRYFGTSLAQLMQVSACNRLHSVEQCCCRWLLMSRSHTDEGTPANPRLLDQIAGRAARQCDRGSTSPAGKPIDRLQARQNHCGRPGVFWRRAAASATGLSPDTITAYSPAITRLASKVNYWSPPRMRSQH